VDYLWYLIDPGSIGAQESVGLTLPNVYFVQKWFIVAELWVAAVATADIKAVINEHSLLRLSRPPDRTSVPYLPTSTAASPG
jgi:hypothetical protein